MGTGFLKFSRTFVDEDFRATKVFAGVIHAAYGHRIESLGYQLYAKLASESYSKKKSTLHLRRITRGEMSVSASALMQVVFVLGGPGSGKGTNCSKIVELFGYVHLSAGDLLREERNSGSELAEMINTFIAEGKIVPAEITVRLLRAAMEKSGKTSFLVDGFPRDMDNLKCWEDTMGDISHVQFLLFLDCPQDVMLARLLERGKTSGRNDDNEESIKKRFQTYEDSTRPIINHFTDVGKVRAVDSHRPFEEVFADVSLHFQS